MERLTSNKETKDMTMIELAHNSCYADSQHNARYRDYNLDIDSRQLARNLLKDICDEDLAEYTDEEFEEYMGEMLSLEMDSKIGLLALFYRNLWAMADLREKLKEFEDLEELIGVPLKYLAKIFNDHIPEDCKNPKKAIVLTDEDVDKWHVYKNAEEQGLLLRLYCNVGDTVYCIEDKKIWDCIVDKVTISRTNGVWFEVKTPKSMPDISAIEYTENAFGETVFLTQAEAEQKLKELRGEQNDRE